jgi:hypothetical protein
MRALAIGLLLPIATLAQTTPPMEFPAGAEPLSPEALVERLKGKVFTVKPASGNPWRMEYKETYAFINVGSASDSGKWTAQGTTICHSWQRFPSGCSEVREAGGKVHMKRSTTGEVVVLEPN